MKGRGERAYDIYSRLLRERIVCVMGPVSDPGPSRGQFAVSPTFLPCQALCRMPPPSPLILGDLLDPRP